MAKPISLENTASPHQPEPITETTIDEQLVQKTTRAATLAFPNLGWETVCIGLDRERLYEVQLHKYTDEASVLQDTIQKLIELNGKLTFNDKPTTLSNETISAAKELEKSSIKLLEKDEKKISPERLAEIKTMINSHIDRLKTELQNKFSTKIQVTINEMNSLLETIRSIIKFSDRLMSTIIANQRKT